MEVTLFVPIFLHNNMFISRVSQTRLDHSQTSQTVFFESAIDAGELSIWSKPQLFIVASIDDCK